MTNAAVMLGAFASAYWFWLWQRSPWAAAWMFTVTVNTWLLLSKIAER